MSEMLDIPRIPARYEIVRLLNNLFDANQEMRKNLARSPTDERSSRVEEELGFRKEFIYGNENSLSSIQNALKLELPPEARKGIEEYSKSVEIAGKYFDFVSNEIYSLELSDMREVLKAVLLLTLLDKAIEEPVFSLYFLGNFRRIYTPKKENWRLYVRDLYKGVRNYIRSAMRNQEAIIYSRIKALKKRGKIPEEAKEIDLSKIGIYAPFKGNYGTIALDQFKLSYGFSESRMPYLLLDEERRKLLESIEKLELPIKSSFKKDLIQTLQEKFDIYKIFGGHRRVVIKNFENFEEGWEVLISHVLEPGRSCIPLVETIFLIVDAFPQTVIWGRKRHRPSFDILSSGNYQITLKLLPELLTNCLLYTSPSPRDLSTSRMPSSA